jgi:hypothetical protein
MSRTGYLDDLEIAQLGANPGTVLSQERHVLLKAF